MKSLPFGATCARGENPDPLGVEGLGDAGDELFADALAVGACDCECDPAAELAARFARIDEDDGPGRREAEENAREADVTVGRPATPTWPVQVGVPIGILRAVCAAWRRCWDAPAAARAASAATA